VEISDLSDLAAGLEGVRTTAPGGPAQWRYMGRLVARQLDEIHLVIRADHADGICLDQVALLVA
jgi:hypothetical protein